MKKTLDNIHENFHEILGDNILYLQVKKHGFFNFENRVVRKQIRFNSAVAFDDDFALSTIYKAFFERVVQQQNDKQLDLVNHLLKTLW